MLDIISISSSVGTSTVVLVPHSSQSKINVFVVTPQSLLLRLLLGRLYDAVNLLEHVRLQKSLNLDGLDISNTLPQ